MQVSVRVIGNERVNRMVSSLPKSTEKAIGSISKEFMDAVKKSAKLRAPRKTGELADSINWKSWGKNRLILTVDSPYGAYQELGFTPHWVHAGMSTGNKSGTIGSAFNIAGFAFVKKHTPFIQPALESNLSKLPNLLQKGVDTAIKNARR